MESGASWHKDIKAEHKFNKLNLAHMQGVFYNVFLTATGLVYMVGYFRKIGFTEVQIGVYGSAIGFACFSNILGSWLVQKIGDYKKTVFIFIVSAISFCIGGVIIGYLISNAGFEAAPYVVLLLMMLYQLCLYMTAPILLSWYHHIVGSTRWQSFFSTRMMLGDAAVLLTNLIVGSVLSSHLQKLSFVCIFILAGFFALINVYFLNKIPNIAVGREHFSSKTYFETIKAIVRHPIIKFLLILMLVRTFAYSAMLPFQTVFLLEKLQFDYGRISILVIIGTAASILAYKPWALLQKRWGNKRCILLNTILAIADPVLWFFACQNNSAGIYIAFALFGLAGGQGLVNAGYLTSALGMILEHSTQRSKPVNTSLFYMVIGLSSMTAPLLGGYIVERFNSTQIYVQILGVNIDGYRFLFALAAVLITASAVISIGFYRHKRKKEEAAL